MAREYRELPQTAGVPAMVPPIKSVPKSVPSAPIAGEAAQAPSAAEPETVVDKTAYPTKPTDTSEYNSLLSTLDRHQAPDDAPNLLDIHEMAAKTKNSRWRSAASKALLLRSVDLMFQSVHIKKTLSEARSQSSGSLPVVQDSSDDEDESGEKGKARIDRPDSINRKVFKFAPSPEAIAEYEKLMEEE